MLLGNVQKYSSVVSVPIVYRGTKNRTTPTISHIKTFQLSLKMLLSERFFGVVRAKRYLLQEVVDVALCQFRRDDGLVDRL